MSGTPLERRRARAEIAYHGGAGLASFRVAEAVAEATRVSITDAMVQAYRPGLVEGSVLWLRVRNRLARVFETAGFEVRG